MQRANWMLVAVALLTSLWLAACGGAPAPAEPAAQPSADEGAVEPAQVRIGWPGSPDTLNPGTGVLAEAYTVYELVYDTMFDLHLDGTFSLTLAESYEVSEDGTVWTFKLRPGIKFHDGEPMTAADVVFSYNLYKSHEDFPYLNSYTGYFESVEAPDENTVVITLSEAIPNMESQLVFLYILPEHIWAEHAEGAAEFLNEEMIGTGPFRLVEYQQNEFVRLAANQEHFLNPPKVAEVIFQTFANEDALVQALQTGQVDMITEMPNTAVPVLRNNAEIELVTGAPFSPAVRDIIINQTAPENCPPGDGVCSGHPALRDRTVRLALAHATDKQAIIDVAVLGLATPGLTIIPNGLGVWYNDSIQDFPFDIAAANQLLDDAGYADSDGDGVRELPDGSRPLSFRLQWPNDIPEAPRIADLLAQSWGQIGVQVEPQAMDPDALTAVCCPAFDFDILIWNWGSDPDPAFLLSVMTTDEIPTGSSETGYANPEFDELFRQQATELDGEKRREIVWQMQEIVHNDLVYIVPYYPDAVQAYRKDRFQGWITDQPKLALEDTSSLVVIEPVR